LRPYLTDAHKNTRILYCLSKIDTNGTYRNHYEEIHVDEKWFYMAKDGCTFVLADGEEIPKRSIKHKKHITKVMFLCAQARPRWIGGTYWDGKIGIWPNCSIVPAPHASVNWPGGTPIWQNETINREKYREVMIDMVLLAVLAKFPVTYLMNGVQIQQDGACSHILDTDPEWLEAVEATGIMLYN
jgi:hypothetical protein